MSPAAPSRRYQEIVKTARAVLEEEGSEGLSMRAVAARIGIRAPSLYEHVADKRALENAIIAAGLEDQAQALLPALEDADPFTGIAAAWRNWALEHPHLYLLINTRPLDRDVPEIAEAEWRAGHPVRAITRGDVDAARVIWAFGHGMVMLELNERLTPGSSVEVLWERGIEALRPLVSEAPSSLVPGPPQFRVGA